MSWIKKYPLLGVIGSLLMFGSWIFQNIYSSEYQQNLIDMKGTQQVIDIAQLRMELWNAVYLQEQSKSVPDKTILAAAALKIIQALTNISAWSSDRISSNDEQRQEIYEAKALVQSKAQVLFSSGKIEELTKLMNDAVVVENSKKLGEQQTQKYIQLRNELADKADMTNWIFISLYFFGSLLLAAQWVMSRDQPTNHE